ncbi:MAG: hypothetical protein ACKO24_05450, partial [Leptolyngbyaceae cyanobacterium]
GEWLPLYEEHHWQKNDRSNPNKQNSFKKNYQMFFKWLPPNDELTVELLKSVVLTRYPAPGKRSRQLCVMAYAALATFVELPVFKNARFPRWAVVLIGVGALVMVSAAVTDKYGALSSALL